MLGDECFVGEGAVVNPGVKVYPFKTVEAGAVVTSSIVWESRGARTLFGRRGVVGLANVDITPEVATRLAMAYGTSLKKGAVVSTSRDTSRVARALKRSIIGGLNLSGVNVEDVELATVPLTRFQVRNSMTDGGISVRLSPKDPNSVEIRILDNEGRDIDEATQRKIERLLQREDFRRAFAGDIGDIVFPPRSLEYYTAALEKSVDKGRLRERSFKVVLDYSFGASSLVMPAVLAKIGADVLAVNPFAATRALGNADDRDERIARIGELVRVVGQRPRHGHRPRRGDRHGRGRRRSRARTRADPARAADARGRGPSRCAGRAAGLGEPRGRAHRERAGCARSSGPSCPRRTSWRSRRATGWTSPPRRRAGSSGPTSCRRTTPPRRW